MAEEIWELMIRRIYRQAAVVTVVFALASLFVADWRHGLGVLVGGLFGMVNLKGIVWAVTSLVGSHKAQAKMVLLSMAKLFVMFSILLLLSVLGLIHPIGLAVGFTIVVVIILKEGWTTARQIKG
ncbi:MAG: ATP synthase subunit I [Thermodesulfovibrionales bacterium]